MTTLPAPFLTFDVTIAAPTSFGDSGEGSRRVIPITGGTVSGEHTGRGARAAAGVRVQVFRVP